MDSIKRLYEALLKGGNTFGGNTFGGQTFGGNTYGGNTFGASAMPPKTPTAVATPTLPQQPFQIPGMNGMAPTGTPPFSPSDVAQATAPRPTQPQAVPPTQPAGPPMALSHDDAVKLALDQAVAQQSPQLPPLPNVNIQTAQSMTRLPQTDADLAAWRQMMDQLQWARQGG